MLPDAAVGRVNSASPIVPMMIADGRGSGFLQIEGWQCRDFGRKIVVGCPFAADGCDRQDQVSDFAFSFETPTFSEE